MRTWENLQEVIRVMRHQIDWAESTQRADPPCGASQRAGRMKHVVKVKKENLAPGLGHKSQWKAKCSCGSWQAYFNKLEARSWAERHAELRRVIDQIQVREGYSHKPVKSSTVRCPEDFICGENAHPGRGSM